MSQPSTSDGTGSLRPIAKITARRRGEYSTICTVPPEVLDACGWGVDTTVCMWCDADGATVYVHTAPDLNGVASSLDPDAVPGSTLDSIRDTFGIPRSFGYCGPVTIRSQGNASAYITVPMPTVESTGITPGMDLEVAVSESVARFAEW